VLSAAGALGIWRKYAALTKEQLNQLAALRTWRPNRQQRISACTRAQLLDSLVAAAELNSGRDPAGWARAPCFFWCARTHNPVLLRFAL
jgi:hypothetical protein